jgi:hypothetical protein
MAKKRKVPKKIAGVKLPKPLRRGLRDLASSQSGRTVMIEALSAAGAALAATQARPGSKVRRAAADQAPQVEAAADAVRDRAADLRSAAVTALEDAARSFTEALRRRDAATETPPQVTTPPTPSASTH